MTGEFKGIGEWYKQAKAPQEAGRRRAGVTPTKEDSADLVEGRTDVTSYTVLTSEFCRGVATGENQVLASDSRADAERALTAEVNRLVLEEHARVSEAGDDLIWLAYPIDHELATKVWIRTAGRIE